MRPLLPHQTVPVARLSKLDVAPCFMDKRLGKCTVAIRWAIARGAKNVLVVAPISAFEGWENDLKADGQIGFLYYKHKLDWEAFSWDVTERTQGESGPVFIVTNPASLFLPKGRHPCPSCNGTGWIDLDDGSHFQCPEASGCGGKGRIVGKEPLPYEIALADWDAVIWDESVNLANPKSQVNKIAQNCFFDVPRKLILSGEYVPNRTSQLFEQMRFLYGGFMGHRKFWPWQAENYRQYGHEWFPKTGRLAVMHKAVAERGVILSRKDAGCEEIKSRRTVHVDLPPKLRKIYDHVERYFEVPLPDGSTVETKYGPVTRTWLRQMAGGYPKGLDIASPHKMDMLKSTVQNEYPGEPIVVSFAFNRELAEAFSVLTKAGLTCVWLNGSVAPAERKRRIELFRAGKAQLLLGQAEVLKYGLNLSHADTMFRYSLPENYDTISQSADRIVDVRKRRALEYVDFVTRGTVDEDVAEAAADKRVNARRFMSELRERQLARLKALFLEKK